MNTITVALLVVAGCFAIGNWVSRQREIQLLEYATKPTVTALLAIAACTLDARSSAARPWFVAALVLSLAGDVLLMLPVERFVEGLASFLCAHVVYIVGFGVAGVHRSWLLVGLLIVPLVIVPLGRTVLVGARRHEAKLVAPVGVYMVVIAAMVIGAVGSQEPLAIGGACLFAFSDSLIAWNRFVKPLRWASVAIMVTYHLGQAGLLLSLAR